MYAHDIVRWLDYSAASRTLDIDPDKVNERELSLQDDLVMAVHAFSSPATPFAFELPLDFGGHLIRIGSFISMAKKKESTSSSVGKWNGITNVPAPEEIIERAHELADQDWTRERLEDLVAADYKVSCSYDSRHDCMMVSISCYDETSPNYKYTMVSRGAALGVTLCLALLKHFVVAEEVWVSGAAGQPTYS